MTHALEVANDCELYERARVVHHRAMQEANNCNAMAYGVLLYVDKVCAKQNMVAAVLALITAASTMATTTSPQATNVTSRTTASVAMNTSTASNMVARLMRQEGQMWQEQQAWQMQRLQREQQLTSHLT